MAYRPSRFIGPLCARVLSINARTFFLHTDMDEQRAKQKSFLTMIFSGPNDYTGKDMRTAHAQMVEKGLTESHFDAVVSHLKATLEDMEVNSDAIDEVMAIAESTRDVVLNR